MATRKPRENAWAGTSSETDAGAVDGAWIALASASHYSIEAAPCAGVHSESFRRARGAAALRGEARARDDPRGRETARREPEPVSP